MRRAGETLGLVAVSALLLLALEGLARVGSRVRWGFWPTTPQEERYDAAVRMGRLLMEHPFLIGVPRPGGAATVRGKSASINSHGYRGPEFDRPKPADSFRILAIGGSTVFDVSVSGDASTWTRRLEDGLRTRFPARRIEVVNGGVPGYTTVEMLLKLSLIDLDVVQPDLVLAYVGLNDLQPSGAPDFRADYSLGHAELQRRFLGFESRPPGLLARSVLLHKIRKRLGLDREVVPETPRRDAPRPEAESVYRERLEEIAEVARAHGAAVVLMTHALRSGAGNPLSGEDFESARRWLPFLTAEGIVRGMERYNAITKEVGEELGVPVVDVARELSLDPSDFADYCHWTDSGSAKAGAFLADRLPDSLFTRASAGSGHIGSAPAGAAAFSAVRGMERYNAITKEVGEELGVPVVDVARELPLDPSDFADYCHWTDSGSAKAGAFLADRLPDSLFTPASAGSGHIGSVPAGAAAFSAR